ncbi:MAG TPA: glucose-6-phosphate dehydrogenase assembly protein OpcA [Ktedonobacterales bacterium]|nr:glucose-6-phosphate dehydrogenase assembly protein OpcA [Ktedonobacterales bacterium]
MSGNVRLSQQFHAVSLAEIEHELDAQWREISTNALAASGSAVSRNTALSLVVYATDGEQANIALGAIEDLTVQFPSRGIVLVPEPKQSDSGIAAAVAVHVEGSGLAAGYGEQIVIEAQGNAAQHVPGLVLPLLVTGLPAFLWWLGVVPWRSPLIESLVDGSDRLIFDSCDAVDSDRMMVEAAELMARKHARCAVSDFNWKRLAPWRELTAQFFDAADMRPYLAGVDRVTVEYAAGDEEGSTNGAQALEYLGWLGARLGWSLPAGHRRGYGPTRQYTLHDSGGRPVVAEINARFGVPTTSWYAQDQRRVRADMEANSGRHATPPPASAPPRAIGHGALMSVRLHAVANRRPGIFVIARDQDLEHATTLCQVDAGAPPSHTVHLPSLGETALLTSQLETAGHDTIFEDALAMAARLVGSDGRRG